MLSLKTCRYNLDGKSFELISKLWEIGSRDENLIKEFSRSTAEEVIVHSDDEFSVRLPSEGLFEVFSSVNIEGSIDEDGTLLIRYEMAFSGYLGLCLIVFSIITMFSGPFIISFIFFVIMSIYVPYKFQRDFSTSQKWMELMVLIVKEK